MNLPAFLAMITLAISCSIASFFIDGTTGSQLAGVGLGMSVTLLAERVIAHRRQS